MTYLEMINSILRRLRERTVNTANESAYSRLIGQLINDAKDEVEESWDWNALKTTLTATTTASFFSYNLDTAGPNPTIISVINDTDNVFMKYASNDTFDNWYLNQNVVSGSPLYYNINGIDADGDTIIDFYPKPDGAYNIRINLVVRSPDLVNNTDKPIIPSRAIEMLAYAKAVEERGEDGGQSAASAYNNASRVLSDAIARDAQFTPENLVYSVV
jgi:hypothetical protein